MLLHPSKVLIGIACIDDEHIVIVGILVDEHVINRAAVLIAHDGITAPAGSHGSHIVGDELLDIVICAAADDIDLAHMGYVKKPCALAHRLALFENAGFILNGQCPSAEIDHLAAERDMTLKQRSLFKLIKIFHLYTS